MNRLRTILNNPMPVQNLDLTYFTFEHFRDRVHFSNEKYQRVPLAATPDRSAYLLCWAPYQESRIHDHPDGGCKVKVLQGTLVEVCYSPQHPTGKSQRVSVGDYSYKCGKLGLHNIKNGMKPAVTLHIYSPDYVPTFYSSYVMLKKLFFSDTEASNNNDGTTNKKA